MEDPESLKGDLVKNFLGELLSKGRFFPDSVELLLELVAAIRFGWLSEWLRKKDEDMIALEGDYLGILFDNRNEIKKLWGIH
jgi:homoserine kinase type II